MASAVASETVLYAAQCLRSDERELALDVIRDSGSLSPEQIQAIGKIIRDLGTVKLTFKDLNLAEARMLNVFKHIAGQPMHQRMCKLNKMASYATETTLTLKEMRFRLSLFKNLNPQEFMECFPELQSLILNDDSYPMQSIAEGIKAHCPKFECLEFNYYPVMANEMISPFADSIKTLIWSPYSNKGHRVHMSEHLNAWARLPQLRELILNAALGSIIYTRPEIFDQFTHLEKLTIHLLDDDLRFWPDGKLTALAHFPNLQSITVRDADVSVEGVREFVAAKKQTLKQMTLSLTRELHLRDVDSLRAEFPTVEFIIDEEGN